MLSTAINESASNIFGIEQAFHSTKKVYRFLNAEKNIAIISRHGVHGVNSNDVEGYIDFFDFVFKRSKTSPENKLFCNYDFDKWRTNSKQNINPMEFEIVDTNWMEFDNNNQNNRKKWKEERKTIKENLQWLLGNEPAGVTNPGPKRLNEGGIGEDKFGSFLLRPFESDSMKVMAITPYSGFGDNLYGYLYYPIDKGGNLKNKNLPVVIYLHEYDYSKGFSSMGYDHEIQSHFELLTKLGFGVFTFDMIGFGNRLQEGLYFYERYPEWSKMGKMVTDIKGAIDAISNLHFVDNSKVFVTGYSLGGTVALLSAALDDRIAGVVSVAGFTPFRTNTTNRGTEGIKSFSHLHGLIPQLGFFVGFEKHIPIDFDQIIASIAPRPVLLIAPLHDKDSFPDDIKNCVSKAETIFKLYTVENNIHLYMPNDHNRFSKISRQKIYDWLANYK